MLSYQAHKHHQPALSAYLPDLRCDRRAVGAAKYASTLREGTGGRHAAGYRLLHTA